MKPAVILMFRNEADILPECLYHWHVLGVRNFYLIDNGSDDESDMIVQWFESLSGSKVTYKYTDRKDFPQAEFINRYKNKALADGCDWIFPADADEFLRIPEQYSTIQDYLNTVEPETFFVAYQIRYKDIFLKDSNLSKWHEPQRKVFGKFPANWQISYGNHIASTGNMIELDDIWYDHYPIRSYKQFHEKVTNYMEVLSNNPDFKNHPHVQNYEKWICEGDKFIEKLFDQCLSTLQWPPL